MIDFVSTECSKGMYFFCFMFFLCIVILFWNRNVTKYNGNVKTYQPIFFALVLIYIIVSFYNGDFWHYQSFVLGTDDYYTPSEPIYEDIAVMLNRNYLLFRIVVWGSALILLLKTFKLQGLDRGQTLFFFFCLYISIFDYARASLAMALFWLGMSYLTQLHKRFSLLPFLCGIMFVILSFFFHHSMLIAIVSCLLLIIPFNKKVLLLTLVLFPLMVLIIYRVISNLTGVDFLGDDSIGRKLAGLEFEAAEMSFLEKVRSAWLFMTFYLPFIIITYVLFFKKESSNHLMFLRKYIHMYKVLLGVILVATSMLFMGFDNLLMFYRILYMSMIPLTVIFCGLMQRGLIPRKIYKMVLLFGVAYIVFRHSKVLLHWQGPIS